MLSLHRFIPVYRKISPRLGLQVLVFTKISLSLGLPIFSKVSFTLGLPAGIY